MQISHVPKYSPGGYYLDRPKCVRCGKFVPYTAPYQFTPDSEMTAEDTEYFCEKCWEKENGS